MSVVSRDGNRRKSLEKVVTPKGMVNGGRSSLGTSGRPTLPLRSPDGRGAHQDALASPTAKNASSAETLTVIARFREPKVNTKNVPSPYVFMDEKMVKVNFDEYESKVYQFDTVFPPSTQQPELFQAVEGTIDSVLKGFNATILAYGQTSSGKTHTMEGPNIRANLSMLNGGNAGQGSENNADNQLGIIPRTIERLFLTVKEPKYSHMEFTVMVSYFEIYCEKMRDLLNPSSDNMKLREYSLPTKASEKASCTGFVVQDITEVVCKDSNDIYNVIDTGKSHRATAPTLMNAESSRSHSILLIKVNQKPSESVVNAAEDAVPNTKRAARLYLVDLAGSEKVGKTGATGERLKEAQNINKSLTSFGMVINALSEGLSHVPYRDSKLTMILMDSIGGNSKTTLIICASPEAAQLSETLSTLRFGERAKKITNTVKVNEELGISEYKALCQAAKLEIAQLKKKLAAAEELNLASTDESSADTVSKEPGSGPGSPEKSASAKRQAAEAAIAMQDALRQQVEDLQYMCLDLESQLEAEKNENIALRMEANANKAEMHLLKCLTDELQSKLFQATTTLQAPLAVPSPTVDVNEGNREPDREPFVTPDQSPHSAAANGSSAPASPVASVTAEDLAEISEQHAVLTQHIMDETESMKAMTATNAAQSAELAQYIEKYYTLNKDSNEQIDRIMAKLNSEQTIRVNAECQYAELLDKYNVLEEQLEAAQRAVTAANDVGAATTESSSGSSFGSFFSSPAKAVAQSISPVTSPVSRRSSWTNLMSGAAAKMFSDSSAPSYQRSAQSSQALQAIIQAQSKQLQALTQANAKLQTSESQLQYEQECTKEQYETLLIMKDNILKTILGENKDLADQKEAFMAEQHEHLATIEQLTYLLRTSMQRKATETQMKMTASPSLVSCRSELSEMDEETFLDMDGDGVDGYDGDRIEEEEGDGDGVEYGDYVDNDGDDNATLDEETEMPMPAVEEEDEGEQEEFEEPVRVHDDASSTEGLDT